MGHSEKVSYKIFEKLKKIYTLYYCSLNEANQR